MSWRELNDDERLIVAKLKSCTGKGLLRCLECLEYNDWDFEKAKLMAKQTGGFILND